MKKNIKSKSKYELLSKNANSNGITLIALIITIIVLLILAGVTINLTLGENGIFRTAEMAGKNYLDAQDRELAGLADFENAINNIIGGTGSSSGIDTPEIKDDTLKGNAQPGDYVKYDTGLESVGENGIITFRVLYNDDTYGLQIISDKNVEQLTLGTAGTNNLSAFQASMNDYNNLVATLNQKAEYYATSSQYAIDGRCVGSVPTIGEDGKFNAKNTEVEGTYNIPDEWTLPSGWSSRDTGCQKWTDTNYSTDETAMRAANIWTTGEIYWLASRSVVSHSSDCNFSVRGVYSSGGLNNCNLCSVLSDGVAYSLSYEYGLRPCISLKSDIKVVAGDGSSEETAYELGI